MIIDLLEVDLGRVFPYPEAAVALHEMAYHGVHFHFTTEASIVDEAPFIRDLPGVTISLKRFMQELGNGEVYPFLFLTTPKRVSGSYAYHFPHYNQLQVPYSTLVWVWTRLKCSRYHLLSESSGDDAHQAATRAYNYLYCFYEQLRTDLVIGESLFAKITPSENCVVLDLTPPIYEGLNDTVLVEVMAGLSNLSYSLMQHVVS